MQLKFWQGGNDALFRIAQRDAVWLFQHPTLSSIIIGLGFSLVWTKNYQLNDNFKMGIFINIVIVLLDRKSYSPQNLHCS